LLSQPQFLSFFNNHFIVFSATTYHLLQQRFLSYLWNNFLVISEKTLSYLSIHILVIAATISYLSQQPFLVKSGKSTHGTVWPYLSEERSKRMRKWT